jgi:hypothetical protein
MCGEKVIISKAAGLVYFNIVPQHCVGGTEENMKTLSQDIQAFKLDSSKIEV